MSKVSSCVLVFTAVIFSSVCRKYDIDDEAKKLYHHTFERVLKDFRFSYDYIEILLQKKEDLITIFNNAAILHLKNTDEILSDKIERYCDDRLDNEGGGGEKEKEEKVGGGEKEKEEQKEKEEAKDKEKSKEKGEGGDEGARRYWINKDRLLRSSNSVTAAAGPDDGDEPSKSPIELLETYPFLNMHSLARERNEARYTAFTEAKAMIERVIADIAPELFIQTTRKVVEETQATTPTIPAGYRTHKYNPYRRMWFRNIL